MHVVISGYYGFGNLGDEAVLTALVRRLPEVLPGVEITVLSASPEQTARQLAVAAVARMSPWAVVRAIWHSQGVISGGGSLLQDSTSWLSPWYYLAVMWLAIALRRPLVVIGQGIGPVGNGVTRRAIAWTMDRAAVCNVRDEQSRRELMRWGVRRPISVTQDLALLLSTDGEQSPRKSAGMQQAPRNGRPVLAVNLRPWPGVDERIVDTAAVCDQAVERLGADVIFIPMQDTDVPLGHRLQERMRHGLRVADVPTSPDELLSTLQGARTILAMRLHLLIFALAARRSFVGLCYDPKVEAFAAGLKAAGCSGDAYAALPWEQVNTAGMWKHLVAAWEADNLAPKVRQQMLDLAWQGLLQAAWGLQSGWPKGG